MPAEPAAPRATPRILLLTRIWPRPDRPSVGTFVRDRARDVPDLAVVRPRRRALPGPLVYLGLLLDALGVRGPLRGVEAHMLLPTGLIGWLVARLRGVPLVVYVHGGDVRGWESWSAPRRWLGRFVARRAARVLTNSADTAAHVRGLGADPVVVPPGVDLAAYRPSPRPRPGDRRVLYLGGKNPRKGHEVAVALADTLVGPWLDDRDPSEIPALIAAHDVVLVPSLAEPFGLVAVEAIASGRWVVARDVGGLRDIVVDGVNGTLVADGDFAGALARVPDYDPATIAATVAHYGLAAWQAAMARAWDEIAPRSSGPTDA
jgi:glycosyltransferase involved in cell wall biosynthesis